MSKHDSTEGREISLRVVRCDGPNTSVMHVTNDEDNIGNHIADGYCSREDGFRIMARNFKIERDVWRNCYGKLSSMSVWDHFKQWLHDWWWKV